MINSNKLFQLTKIVSICSILVVSFYYGLYIPSILNKQKVRKEVLNLRSKIKVGQTRQDVKSLIEAEQFHHIKICNIEETSEVWSICTPGEFGAQNWILFIKFNKLQVSHIFIRSDDGINIKPKDSPEDIP